MNRAVELALQRLSDEHLELLLTGFPAELHNREPTESEAAVLDAYREALEQELAQEESESAKHSIPDAASPTDAPALPSSVDSN